MGRRERGSTNGEEWEEERKATEDRIGERNTLGDPQACNGEGGEKEGQKNKRGRKGRRT